MTMKVASEHFSYFEFLKVLIPRYLTDEQHPMPLAEKTLVVPLNVIPKNEQYYSEVVDIMKCYEDTIKGFFEMAGKEVDRNTKVHVGGDQMTRERFSGAKCLMIGSPTEAECFEHLTLISSELFHLDMKFLALPYKHLYKEESTRDVGTMRAEQIRTQRQNVKLKVKDNYNPDKEFFISFVDSYLVEMISNYFEMDNTQAAPRTIKAPDDPEEKFSWTKEHFKEMLQKNVGTFVHLKRKGM